MERVGDLGGVGEHRVEHGAIRRRQIQGRPLDARTPRLGVGSEPTARLAAVTTRDDIEELAAAHVDDLGRPPLPPQRSLAGEQGLIEPDRGDRAKPARVVNQGGSVEHDGVHHCVPIAPEIGGDLGNRAAVATNLERHPARRPGRQRTTTRRDPRVPVGPRPSTHRAAPTLLAPHQPGRPTEHRQIDQHHLPDPVTMSELTARASRTLDVEGNHDPQPARPLADPNNHDVGQPDQQRAHARRIRFQQGLLDSGRLRTPSELQSPCATPGTTYPAITPPSDPKRRRTPRELACRRSGSR